jgi:HAD superfamily hydrolase (TIGR01509 family)
VTRAVLFDLDGVLINSYEAWFAVVNAAARDFGAPAVTREKFKSVWGQGISADVRNLYPGRTHREVEEAYTRGMRGQTSTIVVNPEARPTLDALRAAGIRTACVTNTQEGLARAILDASGLLAAFDDVEAVREGRREKPAPDLLLAALAALSVAADDALMVGDSRYDEEAAAGAHVSFLHYDFRSGASLRAAVLAAVRPGTVNATEVPMTTYGDHTVRGFLDALASDAPTPGGGTGAAIVGATGAALVRMLAVLTIGRPKFAAAEPLMKAIADQADDNRAALLALADADARSYDAVSAAYKMPKATEAEQAARKVAIQAALKGAIEPPMKVLELCLDTISLAKSAVAQGNPNAVSDGAAGAEFCRAAMQVAAYNVRINLVAVDDERYAKDMRTRLDEALYMGGTAASEIDSRVQDMWKPKPKPPGPMFPRLGGAKAK